MAFENFPLSIYMQAQMRKAQNDRQAAQDIGSIGQNLGQGIQGIVQQIAKAKAKKQLESILAQPQQMPIQGPVSPDEQPGPGMPGTMIPNTNAPNLANLAGPLQTLYPEQFGKSLASQFDPLQQATIQQKLASAKHLNTLGTGANAQTTSVWRNANGEVSDIAPEDPTGWVEYKVKPGQALQTVINAPLQKEKADAQRDRTVTWNKMIDNKQINELVKRTGLTQKQQSALQTNNLRADRAIEILNRPNITWQELALGEIDLAGIMQGGVPHVDEVAATHFPGWQQQAAKWKTYATGHPTENVPEDIRKKVLDLVNGIVQIDNRFLEANSKFAKNMLGKTISGGIKPYEKDIDEMTNAMKSTPAISSSTSSGWGIQKVQ